VCGFIVAYLAGGKQGLKQTFFPVIILAAAMSLTQFLVANYIIWTLGVTVAGIVGLLLSFIITRSKKFRNDNAETESGSTLLQSFSSYIILVLMAFTINLVGPIKTFLSQIQFTLSFPEVQTAYGWVVPAGTGRVIKIFSHPGTILLYSSLIAYFLYRRLGFYKPDSLKQIGSRVLKAAIKSSTGILLMVSLSIIMADSGMTYLLAQGISQSVSALFYPLIAPFIAVLGAFITGSNNNANVLFAVLQMETAQMLNLNIPLILAAQTAGGALGSVLAPAKVIVGCSTVGLGGQEGKVMQKMLLMGLIPVAVVAVLAMLIQLFI